MSLVESSVLEALLWAYPFQYALGTPVSVALHSAGLVD